MDNDCFAEWLDMMLEYGGDSYDFFNPDDLTEKQKIIIDALDTVCHIGGNLEKGIKHLKEKYPDNTNAFNHKGWGQKGRGNPIDSIGFKRVIVDLVEREKLNCNNYDNACYSLSEKIGGDTEILYAKISKYKTAVKAYDKEIDKQFEGREKKDNIILFRQSGEIFSYLLELQNKLAASGLTKLEKYLYDHADKLYRERNVFLR